MTHSESWNRLLRHRRGRAEDFFGDQGDEVANDLDRTLDAAILSASRRMDPAAQLRAWLDVRISGPDVGYGKISVRTVDGLLAPIQGELDAALPDASEEVTRLELVGVGQGSTILHLEPKNAVDEPSEAEALTFASSAIDSAIQRVFGIHDAVEREAPASEIASLGQEDLISKFHKLISVLDGDDLSIDLTWRSPANVMRSSRLTRRGREYAGTLFEVESSEKVITIWGYVYEQSLRGVIKLKRDPKNRRSQAFEVKIGPEHLEQESLRLNAVVRMLVIERWRINKFGQSTDPTYEFIRVVGHDEQLG